MSLINTVGLTEDQRMMREGVLDLLGRHLPWDSIRKMDEAREFPHEAYQALADAGYIGLFYPEALGGMGGSYRDIAVFLETLGYYYTGIAQAITTSAVYAGMHIAKFGTPELQKELVPKIIAGKAKLALGMSEPGTGSDVAGLKTFAERQGDEYVLNGNKVWITCAHVADYLVVIARTDREASRHQGISTLLVDAKAPGVTIPPPPMFGMLARPRSPRPPSPRSLPPRTTSSAPTSGCKSWAEPDIRWNTTCKCSSGIRVSAPLVAGPMRSSATSWRSRWIWADVVGCLRR